MKTLKLIDFGGQVVLIAASLFLLAMGSEFAYFGYFIVGGWQLLSSVAHGLLKDKYFAAKGRRYYLQTLFWVFILGIISIPVWIFYGFGLLIVSPFLAIWYATICYNENELLEQKSLVHLK